MSLRVKDVIYFQHQKLSEEKLKLKDVKIKEGEMKINMNFMKMMMRFSLSITFVLLIGLIMCNVMK